MLQTFTRILSFFTIPSLSTKNGKKKPLSTSGNFFGYIGFALCFTLAARPEVAPVRALRADEQHGVQYSGAEDRKSVV